MSESEKNAAAAGVAAFPSLSLPCQPRSPNNSRVKGVKAVRHILVDLARRERDREGERREEA